MYTGLGARILRLDHVLKDCSGSGGNINVKLIVSLTESGNVFMYLVCAHVVDVMLLRIYFRRTAEHASSRLCDFELADIHLRIHVTARKRAMSFYFHV